MRLVSADQRLLEETRQPQGCGRLLHHVVQLRADSPDAPGDPAMEAGIGDHVWSAEEIARLVE